MTIWWQDDILAVFNVIVIDAVLAGDNAIIVGMAASRVSADMRARVVTWGIAGAVILRIFLAAVTQQLLMIVGLTLAGGFLLLWVCWKMARQLSYQPSHDQPGGAAARQMSFREAVTQVILADATMSVDNVLAVAGAARESLVVLVIGLTVGILLMAVASHFIARLLVRYPWITWVGLAIVFYVAVSMIWDGWHQIDRAMPSLSIKSLLTIPWR